MLRHNSVSGTMHYGYALHVAHQPIEVNLEGTLDHPVAVILEAEDWEEDISGTAWVAKIELLTADMKDANNAVEGNLKVEGVYKSRSLPHFAFEWGKNDLKFTKTGLFFIRIKAKKRQNKALATARTLVGMKYDAAVETEAVLVRGERKLLD